MKPVLRKPWKLWWGWFYLLDDRPQYWHVEFTLFAYSWYGKSFPMNHLFFTPLFVLEIHR